MKDRRVGPEDKTEETGSSVSVPHWRDTGMPPHCRAGPMHRSRPTENRLHVDQQKTDFMVFYTFCFSSAIFVLLRVYFDFFFPFEGGA